METVIVTGMSGAGKSTVLKFLEDFDYFCIDNLPLPMITDVVKLYNENDEIDKLAIGIDIRGIRNDTDIANIQNQLKDITGEYKFIFLDAKDEVLVRRYKETRRNHPLGKLKTIAEAIKEERTLIGNLRSVATNYLDTSTILARDLKIQLSNILFGDTEKENIVINVNTFGFKYGIPQDADLVFDVRFMPNPYYDLELRHLTGDDESVRNYVMNSEISHEFEQKLHDMIKFLIPQYVNEGKNVLVISVGCTGGRHRSVTIANRLNDYIKTLGYTVFLKHNDIVKG